MLMNIWNFSSYVGSINDKPTPEARFTTAVQWYLSSFHAGRKSSIAKKPYNPILGEIFRFVSEFTTSLFSSAHACERTCENVN